MLARSALTSSESEETGMFGALVVEVPHSETQRLVAKVDLVPTVIISDKEPAQLELKDAL